MAGVFQYEIKIDPKMANLLKAYKNISGVDTAVKSAIWDKTLEVSLQEEREIKDEMPVDTGRAKASWGHFTPGDLAKGYSRIGKGKRITKRTRFTTGEGITSGAIQTANAADAIWEESKKDMMVTQGTAVPYTTYLNDGHSSKAPELFIDNAHDRANQRMLDFFSSLGDMFRKLLYG